MRTKNKLVCGIGVNDYEGPISVNGKHIKSYAIWTAMLQRCYSEKFQASCPTYIGCTVADEWKRFTAFKSWFNENYIDGYALDKDIKCRGNKLYSADNCFFVTRELNNLLTHKQSSQGKWPTGVDFQKREGKYRAKIKIKGKQKHLGLFGTPEEAEKAYLFAKGNEIIRQAMLPTTPDKLRSPLIKWGNKMLLGGSRI